MGFALIDGRWQLERTKTGLPNYRDVIGRFKARMMSNRSANYYTDGKAVYSYNWRLAYWDGDKIMYDEHMFGPPYGPTTSGHMIDVRRGLDNVAANRNIVPQRKIEQLGERMFNAALTLYNMHELRSSLDTHWSVEYPWAKIAVIAKQEATEWAKSEHANCANVRKNFAMMYDGASITARQKAITARRDFTITLIDEYVARLTANYGEFKNKPLPTRRAPELPSIMRKDARPVGREKAILAWHLLNEDARLGYSDGRAVSVGKALSVKDDGRIVLCNYGLHASVQLVAAAGYHRGPILTRVLLYGKLDVGADKVAAEHRECIGMIHLYDHPAIFQAIRDNDNDGAEAMALAAMGLTAESREATQPQGYVAVRNEEAA